MINPKRRDPIPGKAVDDEDPDRSPMDGLESTRGPAQPYDVDRVESDRAKSSGPAPEHKTPAGRNAPDKTA